MQHCSLIVCFSWSLSNDGASSTKETQHHDLGNRTPSPVKSAANLPAWDNVVGVVLFKSEKRNYPDGSFRVYLVQTEHGVVECPVFNSEPVATRLNSGEAYSFPKIYKLLKQAPRLLRFAPLGQYGIKSPPVIRSLSTVAVDYFFVDVSSCPVDAFSRPTSRLV